MGNDNNIILGSGDIAEARAFAHDVVAQKAPGAGWTETGVFVGRLGEIAFRTFLREHGIGTELDGRIYGSTDGDATDIAYRGWWIDVKCTSDGRQHALYVSCDKLRGREQRGELSHYYAFVRLGHPRDAEGRPARSFGEAVEYPATICGWVDVRHILDDERRQRTLGGRSSVRIIRADERPADCHTPVSGDLYAIDETALDQDADALCRRLREEPPFDANAVRERRAPAAPAPPPARYSLLLTGSASAAPSPVKLAAWMRQGIKIFLVLDPPLDAHRAATLNRLGQVYGPGGARLFSFCQAETPAPDLTIADGHLDTEAHKEAFRTLVKAAPSFNAGQYLAEHYDATKWVDAGDLVVTASAGTGKTTVMIDHILFLLSTVPDLAPSDITMITFTRKAAHEMRERLADALRRRHAATDDARCLGWIEQLGGMQISTIDSFFNDIVAQQSMDLGYSAGVSIRGLKHERDALIESVMDEVFSGPSLLRPGLSLKTMDPSQFHKDIVLPLHVYGDLARKAQDFLAQRGRLPSDDALAHFDDAIDFGTAKPAETQRINHYLKEILRLTLERSRARRQELDAIEVGDLKEELHRLCDMHAVYRGPRMKFLFVDEFQDTDNVQIQSLAWIRAETDAALFIVGDVKQSIYRFRGAEETAFDLMKDALRKQGRTPAELSLVQNYRTDAAVIAALVPMFRAWRDDAAGYLPRGSADAVPASGRLAPPATILTTYPNSDYPDKLPHHIAAAIHDAQKALAARNDVPPADRTVCVLCRTNWEVALAAQACRAHGIDYEDVVDGGFYQSPPVQDFLRLLYALLYPTDARALFGLFMTPYAPRPVDKTMLNAIGALQPDNVCAYLTQQADADGWWSRVLGGLRRKPFFQLLREILRDRAPVTRYAQMQAFCDAQAAAGVGTPFPRAFRAEDYGQNLHKLMNILYDHFASEFISAHAVCRFLALKADTDTEEELADPVLTGEAAARRVLLMTVHKAKGLEFGAVIVPYTGRPFVREKETDRMPFRIEGDAPLRFGWRYEGQKNAYYDQNADPDAVRREEARILYVALTRAKYVLRCLVPQRAQHDTWAQLLKKGGRNA